MKNNLILVLALLPVALAAQEPKFPYTQQEIAALMPQFPSLEGMLQYSKGFADAQFTENFISESYTDDSDYSRFKRQYYQALATYQKTINDYQEQLSIFSKEQAKTLTDTEMNMERQSLSGMTAKEFTNKSQKEKEDVAMAGVQMQVQEMGLGDIDMEKLSKMSNKEAEEYMAKHMQKQTGLTAKDQKLLENMSNEEAMAYFSRPENKGKLEALQTMAAASNPVEGDYQQPALTPEEINELGELRMQLGDFWNSLDSSKDKLMADAQTYWNTYYRAQ